MLEIWFQIHKEKRKNNNKTINRGLFNISIAHNQEIVMEKQGTKNNLLDACILQQNFAEHENISLNATTNTIHKKIFHLYNKKKSSAWRNT